jgi:hypothetical protein
MGCPSECNVGDNLVFSVCTHDPQTGILTDASAVTWRIYEDTTGTVMAGMTGSMAKLDDANTTGFYVQLVAITAANGFESGKTYTIYIEGTVNGDKGGLSYGFKATDLLPKVAILVVGNVSDAQTAAEKFDYTPTAAGVTRGTVAPDDKGNRTVVFS